MIPLRLKAPMVIALGFFLFDGTSKMAGAMGKGVEAPRMTKEELKGMLGQPDIILLDVRTADEWKRSHSKILGAVRENPEKDIKTWADKYPKEKTLVLY